MKPFKPNPIKKNWLKLTNNKKYQEYKHQKQHYKTISALNNYGSNEALTPEKIIALAGLNNGINFSHSGNSGDIIYALPVVKKIKELTNKPVNFYLELNVPMSLAFKNIHPLGNVMLNQKMADGLIPLLNAQSYIDKCDVLTDQKVHINLSSFRNSGILTDRGNIARWNFYTTGIIGDLGNPWLTAEIDKQYDDTIVIARSSRYNNPLVDYSFLSQYKNIAFVGVDSEYQEMKKVIPGIEFIPVTDFLHMARIIKSCKLFIGNQSFPYSIAEGLKARRLLEVFFAAPNVLPEGADGYDFLFQNHFESLVKSLV